MQKKRTAWGIAVGFVLMGMVGVYSVKFVGVPDQPKPGTGNAGATEPQPTIAPEIQGSSVSPTTPVHKKTENAQAVHAAYVAEGWRRVAVELPDEQLVNLDPALLDEHEGALRQQLLSTVVYKDHMDNAITIALNAKDQRTRLAAIEAIGDRRTGEGAEALMMVFETLENIDEKSQVLGHIRPISLQDTTTDWLIIKLSDSSVPDHHKRQITSKLLMTGLLTHNDPDAFLPELTARVPKPWQQALHNTLEGYKTLSIHAH